MNKLLALVLGFISLLTLLTIAFNLFQDSEPRLAPTHKIFYQNGSFSSTNIIVSKGDRISFKNNSSDFVEVALGTHPDHKNVPGFEETLLKPGEDYTSALDQTGVFNFHNHLNPSASGFITVK